MRPTSKHVYNRDTLVAIRKQTTGVRISSEVCTRIRELRINNVMKWKQRRKRVGRKKYLSQLSCNRIPQNFYTRNINVFTANVRSLRNKEILVRNYILNKKIDFGVITETWYTYKEEVFTFVCK